MSQHELRSLIKSRTVLQSLKDGNGFKIYQALDKCLTEIWIGVTGEAEAGRIKYIYNFAKIKNNITFMSGVCESYYYETINKFRTSLINILEKEYIDCKIDYIETKGYDGKVIEQLIVIDWS
jgi:hypothetical protein